MIRWFLATPPKVGSKWMLRGNDPWSDFMTIKDVKDGWVRYGKTEYDMTPKGIRQFRALYRELSNEV